MKSMLSFDKVYLVAYWVELRFELQVLVSWHWLHD